MGLLAKGVGETAKEGGEIICAHLFLESVEKGRLFVLRVESEVASLRLHADRFFFENLVTRAYA